MGTNPRVKFYLVHMETGQRYPVSTAEVVIGRTSGDLLFPDDPKLSNQHCRIIMTPAGLGVHDMNSANGTAVDGKALAPSTVYSFQPGAVLEIGQQAFKLQEAGVAKRVREGRKRRRRRQREKRSDGILQTVVFVLGVAAVFLGSRFLVTAGKKNAVAPVSMESPYEMVDKEVRATFDLYKKIGDDHQSGKLEEKDLAAVIRGQLLPALNRVQVKLGVVKGETEYERQKLELNKQMVGTLIQQVTAMADYALTKSPKSAHDLKVYSEKLQSLSEKAQILKRVPAESGL